MATAGALGLVATAVLGTATVFASGGTAASGTLYYTCFANSGRTTGSCSPSDVQSASYSYNSKGVLSITNIKSLYSTQGADGLQFLFHKDLVVAGQQNKNGNGDVTQLSPGKNGFTIVNKVSSGLTQVDHISVAPGSQYITAGGYSGEGLAVIPVNTKGVITAGHSCTFDSQGSNVTSAPSVMNTVVWVPTSGGNFQAYYTAYTGSPGSAPGGYGVFGEIAITNPMSSSCAYTLNQLLPAPGPTAGFEAAHGMAYDPSSRSIMLFGSTMIAQISVPSSGIIPASPPLAPASEIVFSGQCTSNVPCQHEPLPSNNYASGPNHFDQGSVDGNGHIFVSDNNGNLVAVTYPAGGLISNLTNIYDSALTPSLDDIAPMMGAGAQPSYSVTTKDSGSTATPGTTISDTAQVSVSQAQSIPGGTVTFKLYGNGNCQEPVLNTPGKGITFSGSAGSPSGYVPSSPSAADSYTIPTSLTASTTYYWVATYTNSAGGSASSSCNGEPVAVTVKPAQPSYSVTTKDSGSTATPGTTISDTAQVSVNQAQSIPGGTVTFKLYGNGNCQEPVLNTPGKGITFSGSAGSPSGYVPSPPSAADSYTIPTSLTASTTYYWVATYTNSAGGSASSSCNGEPVAVTVTPTPPPPPPPTPNTPTVTTAPSAGGPVGTHLSDTAHVTGIVSPGASDNVSFALYSNPTCTTLVDTVGSASLTGPATLNGVANWTATSPGSGFAPTVAGTYYWGVTFNSVNDSANLSSSLVCGEPVTITASSGTLGAHTTPTPTPTPAPAGAVKAASTPTPNTGADLFLAGALAALVILLGGLLLLTAARLRAYPRV